MIDYGIRVFEEPRTLLRGSLVLAVLSAVIRTASSGSDEVQLIKDLMSNYTAYERPSEITREPLPVQFQITLRSIIDLVEKEQTIKTNLWLELIWTDYKLRWDPEEYGNITKIELPVKLVWKPDILMYNSADPAFDQSFPVNVVIKNTGEVKQNPPAIFTSTCTIAIKWFPFDDQDCLMIFSSWTYDGSKLELRVKDEATEASVEGYQPSGEWDLIGVPAKRNIVTYACCPNEPWIDITYTIKLRRRKLYYLVNIITPCLMLASLTLVTFTIPPDAGEKISFGVTILLSLTVFLLMVAEALPANSDAVPLIALYFSAVMVLNAASVVFTVLVLNYHHRTSETHAMPRWVKKGICEWLAWILRIKRPGHEFHHEFKLPEFLRKRQQQGSSRCGESELEGGDANSKPLLPIGEASRHNGCKRNGTDPPRPKLKKQGNMVVPPPPPLAFTGGVAVGSSSSSTAADNQISHTRLELRAILRELRFLTNKTKAQEADDQVTSDWKFAAAVIDRFLLWFFSIATGLASFAILLSAPQMFTTVETL